MTLIELIQKYRFDHDLSQRQFAAKCGLSNGYISMLERGENPKTTLPITPTIQALQKLATGMDMSLTSLFSSVDDMPVELSLASNIIPMPAMRTVPLLGTIACGEPILAAENLDGDVAMPENVKADFALRCKGDSMINARIYDGDIVYIRQQDSVQDGEIAAVLIGDEATLKRFRRFPDHVVLEPENPQYRPLTYWGEDAGAVRVLGKAVAFTSSVR